MAPKPKHGLSVNQIAAAAGISTTTWKQHQSLPGCPVPKNAKDVPAWLRRYQAWRQANGKVPTQASAQRQEDPEIAKLKRESARLSVVLKRLEIGRQMSELVSRKDVVEFAAQAALTVTQRLQLLKRKVAAILGPMIQGTGGEAFVEETVGEEVDACLHAFSRGLDKIHEYTSNAAVAGAGDPSELRDSEEADG